MNCFNQFSVSLLRLISYVHDKKKQNVEDHDRFNLEINIFFDNVFESHNAKTNPGKTTPSWLPREFSEWQTLNKWVYRVGLRLQITPAYVKF